MTSPARVVAAPALSVRTAPRPAPAPRPGTGSVQVDTATTVVRLTAGRRLTLPGAVLLSGVVSVAAALLDLAGDHQLGRLFGAGFVLACLLAAFTVQTTGRTGHLRGLLAAPPLVYVAVVVLSAPLNDAAATGGMATRVVGAVLNALVLHAPALWAGTLLSAAVALLRSRRSAVRR